MAASDLTDLAAVRLFLQKSASDANQDALISVLITQASDLAQQYLGRTLKPEQTDTTYTFVWDGLGELDMAPYELRTATAVAMDVDTAAPFALVAGTDYWLRPKPNPSGTYTRLRLARQHCDTTGLFRSEREVSVTGDWGWENVPTQVALAVQVAVSIWLKREVGSFVRTFDANTGTVVLPDELPAGAKAILRLFRRPAVG